MSKITQLNDKAWAVEVPEDTKNYHVWNSDKPQLAYEYVTKNLIEKEFGDSTKYIYLPPGSYSILGRPEEIRKKMAESIIESYIYSGTISFQAYRNYIKPVAESMEDIISDPIESFESLLKSKGLQDKSILILIKQP